MFPTAAEIDAKLKDKKLTATDKKHYTALKAAVADKKNKAKIDAYNAAVTALDKTHAEAKKAGTITKFDAAIIKFG
jgi:hypothetical protein